MRMDARQSHAGAMMATIKLFMGAAVLFVAALPVVMH
jgi:hypothetical protein